MGAIDRILERMRTFSTKARLATEKQVRVSMNIDENKRRFALNALTKLRPLIIRELERGWVASGLPKGALYDAAIANPLVMATFKGIRVTLQPGIGPISNPGGKSSYSIYKQSAALQYGAVRGPAGKRLKAKIKKTKTDIGGNRRIAAHPYYSLDDAAMEKFQKRFNELMQEQIDEAAR